MRHIVLIALSTALASACGSGQGSSTDTSYDETGDGTTGGEVTQTGGGEEATGEEGPAATGPGRLRVSIRVGNQDGSGTVRVQSMSGQTVAEGRSGETFTVPAGTYRLSAQITDQEVMFDRPSRESETPVTVSAGQEENATVEFPVSRVRLRITRRNRPIGRWRLEVRRAGVEGGETLTLQSGDRHIPMTPGRYEGTLIFGTSRIEVSGIIFQGGATMDVPVNVD